MPKLSVKNSLASAVATKEATDASSVVTQETTLEDSLRYDMAISMQSLSPFVSPAGNGCREDSSKLPQKSMNDAAVALRKQAQPANRYRFAVGCVREKFPWSST